MNEKSFIEKLYEGELNPCIEITLTSKKAKELLDSFQLQSENLGNKLDDELKKEYETMLDINASVIECYEKEAFRYGIRLAIKMFMSAKYDI